MQLPSRVRRVVVAAIALSVLASTACSGSDPTPSGSPGSTVTTAPGGVIPTRSGGGEPEALSSGDPCTVITAADISTALSQTVTDTQRFEAISDEDSTTQECALSTSGKAMPAAGFDGLSALASGFTGRPLSSPSSAVVGVAVMSHGKPYDAAKGDTDKLPKGSKVISKLGTFAVVVAVSGNGGLAFAQTSPTRTVVIYDAEDRKVSTSQMEALLRAAVGRM